MRKFSRIIIFVLIIGLFLAGCATLFDPKKGYEHFSGYVTSQDGKPLESARVEINGQPIRTDAKGRFSVLVKKSKRYVMNIRKPGWGMVSRVFDGPTKGGRWAMPKATIKIVDPTQLIFVQDNKTCLGPLSSRVNWNNYPRQKLPRIIDPNGQTVVGQFPPKLEEAVKIVEAGADCPPGISIQIPANSLVNMAGSPPQDKVQVSVSTVDLFTPGEMPGDFTVVDENGKTMYMRSTGAGIVEVTAKGLPYQLKKGTKAVLTIPIDPTQLKKKEKPDPTIPLLLYDEKNGVWRPRSVAKLNEKGDAYVAPIPHLSAFNMDILKTNPSCVKFRNGDRNDPDTGIDDPFDIEVIIPTDTGVVHKTIGLSGKMPDDEDNIHALYNLPNDTDISMRVFQEVGTSVRPLGTWLVNTGPAPDVEFQLQSDYGFCEGVPVWNLTEIFLEVEAETSSNVTLRWTAYPNASEYKMFIWGGSLIGWLEMSGYIPSTETSKIIPQAAGTGLLYKVRGIDPSGDRSDSNQVTASTSNPPAPIPLSNLQATATSSESIMLTWTDAASNETGYRVLRSTQSISSTSCPDPSASDYEEISLPQNSNSHSDESLDPATMYYYNVQAVNSGGISADACVNATTGYNILGTWTGSGNERWLYCTEAGDHPISVELNVFIQDADPDNGKDGFQASGEITSSDYPGYVSVFTAFNGSLLPNGTIEDGAFAYTDYDPSDAAIGGGSGYFDGFLTNNGTRISLDFGGGDTSGDDPCVIDYPNSSFSVDLTSP